MRTELISVATLALLLGAIGPATAQTPAGAPADKQAAPAQAEPPVAAPAQPTKAEPPVPATAAPAGQPAAPGTAPAGATPAAPVAADRPASPVAPPVTPATGAAGKPMPAPRTSDALQAQCWEAIGSDEQFRHDLKLRLVERILQAPQTKLDHELRARVNDMLRPEIHTADSKRMLRNNKHVVMAYAALWILTVLFVLFMFVRQRSFANEIQQLRQQLEAELE